MLPWLVIFLWSHYRRCLLNFIMTGGRHLDTCCIQYKL
ncbi:hypothetical protein GLYMA_17G040902v4 [Glycine max]|nr:hypothetical protein GLYMA_17G040902v4 [Glycine max]KAH1116679.1 hypothetical protein GYH30_046194 [Glycine max]